MARSSVQETLQNEIDQGQNFRKAFGAAVGIHGVAFGLMIFGIPFYHPKPMISDQPIMVNLMDIQDTAPPAPGPMAAPAEAPQPPAPVPDVEPPPPEPPKDAMPEPPKKKEEPPKKDKREEKFKELDRKRRDRKVERVGVEPTPMAMAQGTGSPSVSSDAQTSPDASGTGGIGAAPGTGGGGTGPSLSARGGSAFPFNYYLVQVRNNLWSQWRPPLADAREGMSATVTFTIQREGTVDPASVSVSKSSGLESYDRSCETAVLSVQLAPLPQDFQENSLSLDCVFRYEE